MDDGSALPEEEESDGESDDEEGEGEERGLIRNMLKLSSVWRAIHHDLVAIKLSAEPYIGKILL